MKLTPEGKKKLHFFGNRCKSILALASFNTVKPGDGNKNTFLTGGGVGGTLISAFLRCS